MEQKNELARYYDLASEYKIILPFEGYRGSKRFDQRRWIGKRFAGILAGVDQMKRYTALVMLAIQIGCWGSMIAAYLMIGGKF